MAGFMPARRAMGCAGLTLLELLVVMAVLSVLLAMSAPLLSEMVHAGRLRGAADNLQAQLRFAMAESVKRNRVVSVTFKLAADGQGWCYGLSEDAACDCLVSASCTYDNVERVVRSTDYPGVTAALAVAQGRFAFQPRRNTVTAGSVTFTAASGRALRAVVSGYGRLRSCVPTGAAPLPGYPAC